MKRNVTKEIKSIARERVGRVKAGKVIVPKTKLTHHKDYDDSPNWRLEWEDYIVGGKWRAEQVDSWD